MTIKILSTLLIATTLASDAFTKDIATLWTIGEKDGRGDKFVIKARNASRKNIYVQSAVLNGKRLDGFTFPASELLKGGEGVREMGPEPKKGQNTKKIGPGNRSDFVSYPSEGISRSKRTS